MNKKRSGRFLISVGNYFVTKRSAVQKLRFQWIIRQKKVTFKPLDGARLREELADKEAELTAALAKSRDMSQELAATGEQVRQQLAAKTEALAASAKELDSLKRSLGEFVCKMRQCWVLFRK
jgi:hypothetical protein